MDSNSDCHNIAIRVLCWGNGTPRGEAWQNVLRGRTSDCAVLFFCSLFTSFAKGGVHKIGIIHFQGWKQIIT